MLEYYKLVIKTAFNNYISDWRDLGWSALKFSFQTATIFIVLYRFPMLGSVGDQEKTALTGALSILVSGFVTLLWKLIVTPADMYNKKKNELSNLVAELTAIDSAELYMQRLSDLYIEGKRKYLEYNDIAEWQSKMDQWSQGVEAILREHFSISAIHKFRSPGNGFEIRTDWSWENVDHQIAWNLKARMTGKLSALDDLIRFGRSDSLPHKATVSELLKVYASKN